MGKLGRATGVALLTFSLFTTAGYAAETQWSYDGATGPTHWGSLSEDYSLCRHGVNQSPIEILDTTFERLFSLGFNYKDVPLQVVRNKHTIEVTYGTAESGHQQDEIVIGGEAIQLAPIMEYASSLNISGENYYLHKIQFHTPSEHSYELRTYPMEVQLHHKDSNGQIAIVSIFYKTGKENKTIDKLWQHIPGEENTVALNEGMKINAKDLLPKKQGYYHYRGSLTTPPCTEGVRWFVLKQANQLSEKQLAQFTAEFKPNNRPRQPKNFRFLLESL